MRRLWWFLVLTACVSEPSADPATDQHMTDGGTDAEADVEPSACQEDESCQRCVDGFCVERCAPPCPNGVDTCQVTVGDCAPCAFRSLQAAIDAVPINSVIEICPGVHSTANVVYDGPETEVPTLTVQATDAIAGYTLDAGGAERVLTIQGGEMMMSGATFLGSTRHAIVIEPGGRLDLNEAVISNVTSDRAGAGILNQGWFGHDTVTIASAECMVEGAAVGAGCAVHAITGQMVGDRLTVQGCTSGVLLEERSFAQLFALAVVDNRASDVAPSDAPIGAAVHARQSELLLDEPRITGNGHSSTGAVHAADIVAQEAQLLMVNATVQGGDYQGMGDCSLVGLHVVGGRPEHLSDRAISILGASTVRAGTLSGCSMPPIADVQLDAAAAMAWPFDVGGLPSMPRIQRPTPMQISPPYYCPPGQPCMAGACDADCAVGVRCADAEQCLSATCNSYGDVGVCFP